MVAALAGIVGAGCAAAAEDDDAQENKLARRMAKMVDPFPGNPALTSHFGWRWDRCHTGTDYAQGGKAPIYAVTAGEIVGVWDKNKTANGYGAVLKSGDWTFAAIHFADKPNVKLGQKVEAGTLLGRQGNTGRSKGAHLHYTIRHQGWLVDAHKVLVAMDVGNYRNMGMKHNSENGCGKKFESIEQIRSLLPRDTSACQPGEDCCDAGEGKRVTPGTCLTGLADSQTGASVCLTGNTWGDVTACCNSESEGRAVGEGYCIEYAGGGGPDKHGWFGKHTCLPHAVCQPDGKFAATAECSQDASLGYKVRTPNSLMLPVNTDRMCSHGPRGEVTDYDLIKQSGAICNPSEFAPICSADGTLFYRCSGFGTIQVDTCDCMGAPASCPPLAKLPTEGPLPRPVRRPTTAPPVEGAGAPSTPNTTPSSQSGRSVLRTSNLTL